MTTILIFVGVLLVTAIAGIPIAFGLMLAGIAMLWQLGMLDWQSIALQMTNSADSFPLLAIPFFLLAGEAMNAGGLSRRLVNLGLALVGHLRGGLGYVAIVTAVLLASLSGSAIADTAVLAGMLVPIMRQSGYPMGRASGLIASGGIIAPVIPPSIGYIVFGVAGNVSITRLFLSGIVPGVAMALALTATWWLMCRRENMATLPRRTGPEIRTALVDAVVAMMLPAIIVGGLKFGIFTPTEAGVVACIYALLAGTVIYREITLGVLYECMLNAVRTTAAVMLLIAAAGITAYAITIAGVPQQLAVLLGPLAQHQTLLMLAIVVIVILVGTALDFIPTLLVLTPVLLPIAKQAGIDPVYFGVIFMMSAAIGLLTPPVGAVLNVVCAVARQQYADVVRGVMPFIVVQVLLLLLLVLFPQIVILPGRWLY
ncbi:TRAP transporter large permease [Rhodovulum sulfidophilum]|uniref:TRAP transporter large permease n=1 Tax=Rhodovulum sulfidophilum TaxID=35806 RepID=UPI000952A5A7|nr:TRAP transporter large permease subunit [Rhodovulum sulfidophilum]MBK5925444.1 L-dehydroascorbate transporter large permease subunit [Rhodovulum sulfidophilum]MBL3564107.1 TRAP transporter large permease subunit [Rhodovulum sulfidophilum]MBL3574975.1 TRAP transporter large permease subunit [Rhodovulum sulfidophilum]MCE8432402.1 TRAP transporter large permease subunit [Rhodovulum sulfidophilum]MCF4119210.1 TRAP transporter large permease subunit [Rhodovulum sulfidophilum]